jgi:hypothetical protein
MVAAVEAMLGKDAFAAAWAEGRAMTQEDAIIYALEDPSPGDVEQETGDA